MLQSEDIDNCWIKLKAKQKNGSIILSFKQRLPNRIGSEYRLKHRMMNRF
jgi:hypothetical protein